MAVLINVGGNLQVSKQSIKNEIYFVYDPFKQSCFFSVALIFTELRNHWTAKGSSASDRCLQWSSSSEKVKIGLQNGRHAVGAAP